MQDNAEGEEHPVILEARRLEAAGDVAGAETILDAEIAEAGDGDGRVIAVRFLLEKARLAWVHRGLEAGAPLAAEADALATQIADRNPVPRVYSLMLMVQMAGAAGEPQSVAQIAGVLARVATRAGATHIAAQAWATRAEHMLAFGQDDEAAEAATKAAKLDSDDSPDSRDARTRAYTVLGQLARQNGDAQRAVALFRSATKQKGELPPGFEVEFVLARVRTGETGADVVNTLDQLANAADLDAAGRDAVRLARLEYWLKLGAFERADAAAAQAPDNYAGQYLRARLALAAGRGDPAADLAQAMVDANPEDPRANLLLGASAILLGEPEPGVAALARAEQLAEKAGETAVQVEAIVRMGSALLAGGHTPEARQRARDAMAAAGDDVALRADGQLLMGLAQVAGGQVEDGLAELARTSGDLKAAGLEARAAQVELHRSLAAGGATDEAARLAQTSGARRTLVLAHVLGAFAAHADGDIDAALQQLVKAREVDREGDTGLGEAIQKAFDRLGLEAGTA